MGDQEALRDAELLAADAVGDTMEYWGFRKALGRVWTVLYLSDESLPAQSLAERLQMSAGAVSMALGELQRWGVVRRVWRPGERREFFEAETDFWKMISKVVSERERFLAASVAMRLEQAVAKLKTASGPDVRAALDRIRKLLAMASMARTVIEAFVVSRQADFSEFGNLLELTTRPLRRR